MKPPKFSVRAFAVLCVAVISGYVMWLGWQTNNTLSGPGWCATALGAGKASAGSEPIKGLEACVGLLTVQLNSLSTNSHILLVTIALCLLVLMVVVIAQAHLEFRAGPDGVSGNMSRDPTPVQVVNPPESPVPVQPHEDHPHP